MTRGEIWLVAFDPALGDEIRKTRPAVLISHDSMGLLNLRIVVPITAWQPAFERFPWMIYLEPDAENGLSKASGADAFQVKSVSTRRLMKLLGTIPPEVVDQIAEAIGAVIAHP